MDQLSRNEVRIAEQVKRALEDRAPIVALESTVIAHGLPHPLNLETALASEAVVRQHGAMPATIGIVGGVPTIGLSEDEIRIFAAGQTRDGRVIEKVGLNNLASVTVRGGWGATTVASTLRLAHAANVRVVSTGGIGGVHRGAAQTFDVSADLIALGNTPVICVCAGAKSILDLPKTREYLETIGVPVLGYGTEEFPAFYSRDSGLPVDARIETPEEAADIAERHWRMGGGNAVLVCVPVPVEFEIPGSDIERASAEAIETADRQGIRGKTLTPFLLAQLEELTGGNSLAANRALLTSNAGVAARIALSLSH